MVPLQPGCGDHPIETAEATVLEQAGTDTIQS